MIVVRLMGGLGNQMFQYALGRAISMKKNSNFYLDLTQLINTPRHATPRRYDLDVFNIQADIAPPDILKKAWSWRKSVARIGLHKIFGRGDEFLYVKERTIDFDPGILDLPDNVYLDGYWQSEKYFLTISDTIRKDFVIIPDPTEENQKILDKIQGCNSVSIHIRRQDYVTNPVTRRIHYVCDEEYYRKAIERIIKQVEDPNFFVFSDDPAWAQKYVVPDAPVTYITHNIGKQSYEDLRLISHCHHHIIANSSFSWWGAWLSLSKSKVILAPKKWFPKIQHRIEDRIPPNWTTIG